MQKLGRQSVAEASSAEVLGLVFEEQEEVEWLEGRGGAGAWGLAGKTCTFLKGLA